MSPLHVVGAAIVRDGLCLVAQRAPDMTLPGKWEFPGGKVEPGEAAIVALAREILEELGLDIAVGEQLGSGSATVQTKAGPRVILLDVYAATITSGTPQRREHARVMWASADELLTLDWAEADIPSVPQVVHWLRGVLAKDP